ncbi:class I SAM-dependent methyltransferase [Acrocarpospora catenulata]|uniref:class I SAM-dependent methyltransferase n=1 Tax=Acrocarpospora catenulata TaxID=2836182 RepID=UPI001BDB2F37|nr:class I SAM-dependent methyltransferase [Acrocarpospora catenulata]
MSTPNIREIAADLAAVAALMEIADNLGIFHLLTPGATVSAAELAGAAELPEHGVTSFLEALVAAGLLEWTESPRRFRVSDDFADRTYEAGYLSWSLGANRPFIEHAAEFLRDPVGAAAAHRRNGRHVAVSSRWIGAKGFYPAAIDTIVAVAPRRIVDLGAGAAGLLIDLLGRLPEATGVALDLSGDACREAGRRAAEAGLAERLEVVERSVESLAQDPSPVRGADVIHAGFVFHDVIQDADVFDLVLKNCHEAMRPGGIMAITDAVPYAPDERERRFSALFTYLHASSMGVRLPSEEEWLDRFTAAGFAQAECRAHRFPTGRLFVATKS